MEDSPSSSAPRSRPSFLRGESAGAILAHLSQGDPLRLAERSARRLRERFVLLDPDRVLRRALAVCAEAAAHEEIEEDLEAWTLFHLDLAIDQLVHADREAEQARPGELDDEEQDFPLLTQSLSLDPACVRPASVAFNELEELPRRAFFELLIEGRPVGDVIEQGPWDEDGLYAAIQCALTPFRLDMPGGASAGEEDSE